MFRSKQKESGKQYTLTSLGANKVDKYFDGSLNYRVMNALHSERFLTLRELEKGLETDESKVKEALTQLMNEFKYVVLRKKDK